MEVVTLRGAWPKGTAAAPGRRRRIRLNAAMRERLALVGLVAVSAVLRFAAARGVSTPWIAPDEMLYGLLGCGLYATGRLSVLGGDPGYYSLVYPALVGLPLSLHDTALG